MRLLTPLVPDPTAPLGRINPVAKLAAGLALLIVLFASLDAVTAAIVAGVALAAVPASGLSPSVLLGRAWLIGLVAVSIGMFNVLFAAEQLGPPVVEAGAVRIGAETVVGGVGVALRLLTIALVGLLATATSDPTEMADALIGQFRVSPRYAIGVLAALRILPLMARDWQSLGMARRARGMDANGSPLAALRLFGGRLMALLVGAVRIGTRMALAMEARGFGAQSCRTRARPQRMRPTDWAFLAGAIAVGAIAVAISVALGTWRPLIG